MVLATDVARVTKSETVGSDGLSKGVALQGEVLAKWDHDGFCD